MPLKFSCARVDRALNCAWTRSNRRWISRPRNRNSSVISGSTESIESVRRGLRPNMNATDATSMIVVCTERIKPTPARRCTARMSFTARAIRSPVGTRWKNASDMRCRCAK